MNRQKRLIGRAAFIYIAVAWSCTAFAQPVPAQFYAHESQGERQEKNGDEEGVGRSFLFKEMVLSIAYKFDEVAGLSSHTFIKDHFEISPRPPGSYIGLDYVKTFTSSSPINKILPDWLQLKAMDLHPRLAYDRMQRSGGLDPIEFAPQDFWLRFNPGNVDRLILRVGQFVIPYGVNPILAPRQRFILPVEAADLGLKWDWGLALKGPAGEYDWEIAATIGSGEAFHSPRLFSGSERESYLLTGRIGSPTYWDFQHGISFLYGDLPVIMGPTVISDVAISRWRVGYDAFYKYGTYLMAGAQLTYGQDGFAGDEEFVMVANGKKANILGSRAWLDWVIPKFQNVRLAVQFESVIRDLSTWWAYNSAIIFQIDYSFTTTITAMLDYREGLNPMGRESNALYLTFIYYSR